MVPRYKERRVHICLSGSQGLLFSSNPVPQDSFLKELGLAGSSCSLEGNNSIGRRRPHHSLLLFVSVSVRSWAGQSCCPRPQHPLLLSCWQSWVSALLSVNTDTTAPFLPILGLAVLLQTPGVTPDLANDSIRSQKPLAIEEGAWMWGES